MYQSNRQIFCQDAILNLTPWFHFLAVVLKFNPKFFSPFSKYNSYMPSNNGYSIEHDDFCSFNPHFESNPLTYMLIIIYDIIYAQ